MNAFNVSALAVLLFTGGAFVISAERQNRQRYLETADNLFKAGQFAEAKKLYTKVLAEDPTNFRATARLGEISLFGNRLDEAQKWLTKAIGLRPDEPDPKYLLAEVSYRRDDYGKAVPLLLATGREAKARKLESFKGAVPYQIDSKGDVTHLKFVMTDPLPVVQVRVNGSEKANFFIDTGGAEVIIDSEFAQEVGAGQFGSAIGTYAGGKKATYEHGRIDSLALGDFVVRNLPVFIQNVRQFSEPIFGGVRVDGIIGTVLLYHFLPTLDYSAGELILRRQTKENLKRLEEEARARKHIVMPFWMAGDHYMVAWGTVNKSQPMLLFVDTGLAGTYNGFTCPESTLKEARIRLLEDQAGEGMGGGGKTKAVPFVLSELTLGDAREQNIPGVFLGDSSLEYVFGFRIGGLISHGFFRPYALTFDFARMRLFLKRK